MSEGKKEAAALKCLWMGLEGWLCPSVTFNKLSTTVLSGIIHSTLESKDTKGKEESVTNGHKSKQGKEHGISEALTQTLVYSLI